MIRNQKSISIILFLVFNLIQIGLTQGQTSSLISKVDPFWGCDGGNVFVGACSPFGMVRLGPDCAFPTPTSGYISNKPIIGFSHTHLSGTGGGGRYGNILVSPMVGEPDWKKMASESKENEKALPGYYAVDLIRKSGTVYAELTANQNVGRHRYKFKKNESTEPFAASLLFDLAHTISRNPKASFKGTKFTASNDGSFSGSASFTGGWGGENPYTIYFRGQANFKNATLTYKMDTTKIPAPMGSKKKPTLKFDTTGFALTGNVEPNEEIDVTVSISYKNLDETQTAFTKSMGLSFDAIKKKTEMNWEDRLSVFTIESFDADKLTMFYSSLYHTMIMPTDVSGHHPDDKFGESHFWEHYTFWDTFRCLMPLHNLVYPGAQRRIFHSLIRIGEAKNWLPDAWIAGDFAQAQGGCNAEIILSEAVQKGLLTGLDVNNAWKVCYANAMNKSSKPDLYGRQPEYLANGYCTAKVKNCTSASLEYAYNDFALSQMAIKIGKLSEGNILKERSEKVLNLWYPAKKFFWAKDSTQKWMPNFTPEFMRPDHWNGPYFYEGNPWLYHLSASHLTDTIVALMGGKEAFVARLDTTFEGKHFDMGNEPGFLLPYSYLAVNEREKCKNAVQKLLGEKFVSGRKGLPGQDDSGALSSWLVWGYLGLYPIAGTENYYLIPPFLDKAEIHLQGGKTISISGKGPNPFWNGKPFAKMKIKHSDLIAGGKLEWK